MKIALTYTGTEEKNQNYIKWLRGEEKDITIVVMSVNENNLIELDNCDALVLSGGRDIHPKFYKSEITRYPNSPDDFDEKRDSFEKNAFLLAQQRKLPVLGICRGMQLVNSILGGNLKQDLGENLNKIHKADQGIDKIHQINVTEHTLMNEIAGVNKGIVNSAHHQAIDKPAEGLRVNCLSDDNTIEGLEWTDATNKPFLLCVQWHPERMFKSLLENSPLSQNIRKRFIEEVLKSKESK
jgi:putative glutamine amidotransferase